jgi:hypothetical protein
MHHFDAARKNPGAAKSLELQHGSGAPLDRPTILLDYVVEIYGLADLDRRFTIRIDCFERARLAPLLSTVTVSGTPFWAIDFSK